MKSGCALGALVAAMLGACGGGGGGSASPPLPTGSLFASQSACTTLEAASPCQVTLSWSSTNGANTTVTRSDGAVVGTAPTGSALVDIEDGSNVFTFSFGGVDKQVTVTGSCIGGTAWDSTTRACKAELQHYANVHVAVRFGRPGLITPDAPFWQEATNQTSYRSGAVPITNALMAEHPLPDGRYLELVQAASDGDFHVVSHNVITNTLTDYTGATPAGYEVTRTGPSAWNFGAKWHACMRYCFSTGDWGTPPFPDMSTWADDGAGGWFYTDVTDSRILRHRSADGAASVLYTATDGGTFTSMNTLSN